ncbi:MAG: hypothetical protein PVJ09_03675 [Candidatus Woesebacteria bacterium]|jgi:hypothetical protein
MITRKEEEPTTEKSGNCPRCEIGNMQQIENGKKCNYCGYVILSVPVNDENPWQ